MWHSAIKTGAQHWHRKPQQAQQVLTGASAQQEKCRVKCFLSQAVKFICTQLCSFRQQLDQPALTLFCLGFFHTCLISIQLSLLILVKTQSMDQNQHLLIGQIPGAHLRKMWRNVSKSEKYVKTCNDSHSPDQELGILCQIQNCLQRGVLKSSLPPSSDLGCQPVAGSYLGKVLLQSWDAVSDTKPPVMLTIKHQEKCMFFIAMF